MIDVTEASACSLRPPDPKNMHVLNVFPTVCALGASVSISRGPGYAVGSLNWLVPTGLTRGSRAVFARHEDSEEIWQGHKRLRTGIAVAACGSLKAELRGQCAGTFSYERCCTTWVEEFGRFAGWWSICGPCGWMSVCPNESDGYSQCRCKKQ